MDDLPFSDSGLKNGTALNYFVEPARNYATNSTERRCDGGRNNPCAAIGGCWCSLKFEYRKWPIVACCASTVAAAQRAGHFADLRVSKAARNSTGQNEA